MQVINGMDPREAWVACGGPNGETGIQNIRKRGLQGRRLKEVKKIAHLQSLGLVDEVLGSAAVLAPPQVEVTPAKGKGQPVKGFRLTTTQAGKQKDLKAAARADYNVVYAAATAE